MLAPEIWRRFMAPVSGACVIGLSFCCRICRMLLHVNYLSSHSQWSEQIFASTIRRVTVYCKFVRLWHFWTLMYIHSLQIMVASMLWFYKKGRRIIRTDSVSRDSRKSQQKNGKKHGKLLWKLQKSRQNHGKDTASNHGPKHHYTVYKTQDLALTTIMTCSARFSSVKFCRCGALTKVYWLTLRSAWRSNVRKIHILGKMHISTMTSRSHIEQVTNKAHDFGSRGKNKGNYFCVKIIQ